MILAGFKVWKYVFGYLELILGSEIFFNVFIHEIWGVSGVF
jgi:hypothetical protein